MRSVPRLELGLALTLFAPRPTCTYHRSVSTVTSGCIRGHDHETSPDIMIDGPIDQSYTLTNSWVREYSISDLNAAVG